MRVNVYAEEMPRTPEVDLIYKGSHVGVRVTLLSSPFLHHCNDDDDRSAVTFWGRERCLAMATAIIEALKQEDVAYAPTERGK